MKTIKYFLQINIILLLVFTIQLQAISQESNKQKAAGNWAGKLDLPGMKLEVIFKIAVSDKGNLTAKLDVPLQGAKDIHVNEVILKNDSLTLIIKMIQGSFKGTFVDEKTIIGKWNQRGTDLPLTLKKTDNLTKLKRPQTPQKPFNYNSEEVQYENKSDHIFLAGTLTLPKNAINAPAVILITGSGSQDRDETIFGHKPFLVLADYLTTRGIAVLRVDDRGIGGSGGNPGNTTSKNYAGDVLAGVEFLKNHKLIDAKNIGLIGHSEGGIIAPMVANKSHDISYIVLWAGSGIVGEQILYEQGELINRASGLSESQIKQNRTIQKAIFDIILNEEDPEKAISRLEKAYSGNMYSMLNIDQKNAIDQQIKAVSTPWFKYFLSYNPYPALTKVQCPVLALFGEKDLQVPSKVNLGIIEKALTEGGNKNFKVLELKNLNHLFQNCKTGTVAEYAQIEETIAPEALEIINDWIQEVIIK